MNITPGVSMNELTAAVKAMEQVEALHPRATLDALALAALDAASQARLLPGQARTTEEIAAGRAADPNDGMQYREDPEKADFTLYGKDLYN